ncbi:MAG: hypothetical protein GY854_18505 [Deltaproteobacteria bacterium]|nr:hypothetical protein [Deltaproteobacteria bacterium]
MNRNTLFVSISLFLISFSLVLFELLLTRLFGVVLFAQFAHLALALALLGIGVGAVAQHLWPQLIPEEGLERRLAWIMLIQAAFTIIAVFCTLNFPIVAQFETPPETLGERSSVKDTLLNQGWFIALLPILTLPFTAAGLVFSGVFQRMKKDIGVLYGADLIGGAVGAVVFLPILGVLAGPDTVFVIIFALCAGALALFMIDKRRIGLIVTSVLVVASLVLSIVALTGNELLRVKYAAGYSENQIVYNKWTPLTRISIHKGKKRGDLIVLDNTSASEVCQNKKHIKRLAKEINRSLIYELHDPSARVAILAASAGPEVAVAQQKGFRDIDAIDIAGDIFSIVKERYADIPVNPYRKPGVRTLTSDGRAAILHAKKPYDIIQMVHANLWSSAGLLSSAWSPSLLETVEAFETYLDKLTPTGTISFGRGSWTVHLLQSAVQALKNRGIEKPWRHIAYVMGTTHVLLVKKQPWTKEERNKLAKVLKTPAFKGKMVHDPTIRPRKPLDGKSLMTDDRPYIDDLSTISATLNKMFERASGKSEKPLTALYRSIVLQVLFVLAAGVLFVFLPMIRRGPTELKGLKNLGLGLFYVSCLGYAYLAVETVLIHELVLFVGHPTYAVTIVILSMLLFSGIGSLLVGRLSERLLLPSLRIALIGILALGALQAWIVPDLLYSHALGLSISARMILTGVVIAPLGLLMGMPFPTAMRLLPTSASGMVPWAWALNGWMSVVAGLCTVLLSRLCGYNVAFAIALGAYTLALILCGAIPRIQRR